MLLFSFIAGLIVLGILLYRYIGYLKSTPDKEGDNLYFYEGEFTFMSMYNWLERIEKASDTDYSEFQDLIISYDENSLDTGRDLVDYEDYIIPRLKYMTMEAGDLRNERFIDPFTGWLMLYILFYVFLLPIIYVVTMSSQFGISAEAQGVAFIMVGMFSLVFFFAAMKVFTSYLKAQEKSFRKKGYPLGAINKAILGLQRKFSIFGQEDRIGAAYQYGAQKEQDDSIY